MGGRRREGWRRRRKRRRGSHYERRATEAIEHEANIRCLSLGGPRGGGVERPEPTVVGGRGQKGREDGGGCTPYSRRTPFAATDGSGDDPKRSLPWHCGSLLEAADGDWRNVCRRLAMIGRVRNRVQRVERTGPPLVSLSYHSPVSVLGTYLPGR